MIDIPVANIKKNQYGLDFSSLSGDQCWASILKVKKQRNRKCHLMFSGASCLLISWLGGSKHQVMFTRSWESDQGWLDDSSLDPTLQDCQGRPGRVPTTFSLLALDIDESDT